jgi:transposase-like protein
MARNKITRDPENAKPAEATEPATTETQAAETATAPETPSAPAAPASKIERVTIAALVRDPEINCRVDGVNQDVVKQYAEAMTNEASFPPVVVFSDGERLLLADGWHRCAAAAEVGETQIQAIVREGGREAAMLFAATANTDGFRRTSKDKRRAVERVLGILPTASSREIAARCGVHHDLVESVRKQLADSASSGPRRGKDGKVRGKKRSKPKGPKLTPEQQAKADAKKREETERAIRSALNNALQTFRKRHPPELIQACARTWLESLKSSNDAEKAADGGAA